MMQGATLGVSHEIRYFEFLYIETYPLTLEPLLSRGNLTRVGGGRGGSRIHTSFFFYTFVLKKKIVFSKSFTIFKYFVLCNRNSTRFYIKFVSIYINL